MEIPPSYPGPPPVAPPTKPSRLFLWLGLAAGALLIVVAVVGFLGIRYFTNEYKSPLPDLADAISCYQCFDNDDALSLAPGKAGMEALGVAGPIEGYEPGFMDTAGSVYREATGQYSQGNGTPFGCSFALAQGPVTVSDVTLSAEIAESIVGLGTYGDKLTTVSQTVRVFRIEADADTFPDELTDALEHCTHYAVDLGDGEEWETDVVPVKFDVADPAVRVVAWREESGGSVYTVADLQYRNLVVRSILSDGGGHITEDEFADFVLETSRALRELTPVAAPTAVACSSTCFTVEQAEGLVPASAALESLGAPRPYLGGVPAEPNRVSVYAADAAARYDENGGDPAGCEFMVSTAPLSPNNPDEYSRDETVIDLGVYGVYSTVGQTVQIFGSPVRAEGYLPALAAGVAGCTHFELGEGEDEYIADVAPLTLPTSSPDVTAAGWTETSTLGVYTVVDIRYANLVLRTVFYNPVEDGVFTDEQIAAFVLATSERLTALG